MRYRKLDPDTGDYTFGLGQGNFYIDQPEAVAQSVFTRLMLWTGQWFLDLQEGTAWASQVLGERTRATRDIVLRDRVQTTQGVQEITDYDSVMNTPTRTWTARVAVQTIYGPAVLTAARLPADVPSIPGIDAEIGGTSASLLGIQGSDTPVRNTPADLTVPHAVDIADFQIIAVDGGRYT
jgi:hypothetical protein